MIAASAAFLERALVKPAVRLLTAIATSGLFAASQSAAPSDEGRQLPPKPFLRFTGRDSVEIKNSKYLLRLDGDFTIEAWVRWSPYDAGEMYFAGDEAWHDMSAAVEVDDGCGWVLRTRPLEPGEVRKIDFTIAARANRKIDWKSFVTGGRRCIEATGWHHLAVSKTATEILVFWNGTRAAKGSVSGLELMAAPTPLYLGVRKSAHEDRRTGADLRAFRISSKARYASDFKPPETLETDDATLVLFDATKPHGDELIDLSGKGHTGHLTGARWVDPKEK